MRKKLLLNLLNSIDKDDRNKILQCLNRTKHVTECPRKTDEAIFHTGIYFELQTGIIHEVFYDYSNDLLLRQPINEPYLIRPILGGVFQRDDVYINLQSMRYVCLIDTGKFFCEMEEVDEHTTEEYSQLSPFIIRDTIDGEIINEIVFSRTRKISFQLYFGNGLFKQNFSDEEFRVKRESDTCFDDQLSNGCSDFYDATDGQLGDLDDEGWNYLGREG